MLQHGMHEDAQRSSADGSMILFVFAEVFHGSHFLEARGLRPFF